MDRGEPTTMKEIPPNSFFKEVKPILLILRAFGRFPYGMTNNGILPFSLWSIPAVYCLTAYACIFYFSVNTMKVLIQETFWKTKTYDDKLLIFILISFLSHNFVVPLTFWLPAPRLVKYIENWSRLECEFRQEFKELRLPIYIKYLSIILVPIALVHVFFVVWMILQSNEGLTLVFFPVTITSYLCMLLWFGSLYELRLQAKALRLSILKRERVSDLDKKRRCWSALSCLASETGHCQGSACGYLSLSAFVCYIICIYGFFSRIAFFTGNDKLEWQVLIPLCCYTLFFYFMFDCGETISKEIGTKFISMILEMRDTHSCLSDNYDELSLFLLTMYTGQPKLTFSGFTIVNRALIGSLLSNTVTFLLVLIQFKN